MKKNQVIILIIGLAFILRIIVLNQSFWLDEAIGAVAVRQRNLLNILLQFPKGDNHPPLYYVFLDLWTTLFGYSEIAARSLSVLAGVFTVWVTYRIANLLFKKESVANLTALLLATSPFHVYYSQEARMYVFTGLFAALVIYFFLKTLSEESYHNWIGLSLFLVLLIFTDYLPVLLLPVLWLWVLLLKKKPVWWRNFLIVHLPLVILGLLWLPIFFRQLEGGAWIMTNLPAWRTLAGGATIKQAILVWMKFILGRISFNNKTVYYSLILFSSIPYLIVLLKAWSGKKISILWLWLLLPLITAFLMSFVFPAFIYFRFLFIVPAFYLLSAAGCENLNDSNFKKFIVIMLLSVNCLGLSIYFLDKHQHREDWKTAVSYIESRTKLDDVVLFENVEPFAPYQFYSTNKAEAAGAVDLILGTQEGTKQKVSTLISDKKGVYLFNYLHDLHDPEGYVVQTLMHAGYTKSTIYNVNGVGSITYWTK